MDEYDQRVIENYEDPIPQFVEELDTARRKEAGERAAREQQRNDIRADMVGVDRELAKLEEYTRRGPDWLEAFERATHKKKMLKKKLDRLEEPKATLTADQRKAISPDVKGRRQEYSLFHVSVDDYIMSPEGGQPHKHTPAEISGHPSESSYRVGFEFYQKQVDEQLDIARAARRALWPREQAEAWAHQFVASLKEKAAPRLDRLFVPEWYGDKPERTRNFAIQERVYWHAVPEHPLAMHALFDEAKVLKWLMKQIADRYQNSSVAAFSLEERQQVIAAAHREILAIQRKVVRTWRTGVAEGMLSGPLPMQVHALAFLEATPFTQLIMEGREFDFDTTESPRRDDLGSAFIGETRNIMGTLL